MTGAATRHPDRRPGPRLVPVIGAALSLAALLAAATTLWGLFRGPRWLVPTVVVCLIMAVTGAAARGLGARPPVPLGAQLLAGFGAVTALFVPDHAVAAVLPTPSSWAALREVFDAGTRDVYFGAVPVEPSTGIALLTCLGLAVTYCVVEILVVDLRQPAWAGLPLLCVVTVAAGVGQVLPPAPALFVAGLGYVMLLAWAGRGAVRPVWRRPGPSWWPALVVPGVLVAALCAVQLLPPVGAGALGGMAGGRNTTQISVVNPILTLRDDLTQAPPHEVLSYTTTQQGTPAPLRLMSLDDFTGEQWRPGTPVLNRSDQAAQGLPAAPGLDPQNLPADGTGTYTMRVRIGDLDQEHLPVPYPATAVEVHDASRPRWLYDPSDLSVVGDGVTARNRRYTVTVAAPDPTPAQLANAPEPLGLDRRFLALPRGLPTVIRDTARRVTAGAVNDYERATALQQWFRDTGGFSYSTQVADSSGTDAIAAFLATRSGYCVQFASAMAVMARALGVPARVAVGFLPGRLQDDGSWAVNIRDAHAWPELYFEGTGWVRFEPTPSSQSGRAPAWTQPDAGAAPGDSPAATASAPAAAPSAAAAEPQAARDTGAGGLAEPPAPSSAGSDAVRTGSRWRAVLVVVAALVAAALLGALGVPRVIRSWARRRRWRRALSGAARAEAAWDDLVEAAARRGTALPESATPREARALLGAVLAERASGQEAVAGPETGADAALRRVTSTVEGVRYAGAEQAVPDGSSLRADVARVAAGLDGAAGRRGRWAFRRR